MATRWREHNSPTHDTEPYKIMQVARVMLANTSNHARTKKT